MKALKEKAARAFNAEDSFHRAARDVAGSVFFQHTDDDVLQINKKIEKCKKAFNHLSNFYELGCLNPRNPYISDDFFCHFRNRNFPWNNGEFDMTRQENWLKSFEIVLRQIIRYVSDNRISYKDSLIGEDINFLVNFKDPKESRAQ